MAGESPASEEAGPIQPDLIRQSQLPTTRKVLTSLLLTTLESENFRIVFSVAHRALIGGGKATVEFQPGRWPGPYSNSTSGVVAVRTCCARIVHTWLMAPTAGVGTGRYGMLAEREIGDDRRVVARDAEIGAACRIIERFSVYRP